MSKIEYADKSNDLKSWFQRMVALSQRSDMQTCCYCKKNKATHLDGQTNGTYKPYCDRCLQKARVLEKIKL